MTGLGVHSFSQSIALGHELGLIGDRVHDTVQAHARKFNDAVDPAQTLRFEYFGLRTLYDRYLLRHPHRRCVIETPQQFFMRIAVALTETPAEALELYRLMSSLDYLPSSPTLFNAGTRHEQLSSCFRRTCRRTRWPTSMPATARSRSCPSSAAGSAWRTRGSAHAGR